MTRPTASRAERLQPQNPRPQSPRLEHANLVVTAIEPTLDFLKAAFPGWRVRGEARDEFRGHPRRWVHFGDDESYLTLNDYGRGGQRDLGSREPGLAHLGFVVEGLDDIVSRLKAAGHEPTLWGPEHPHRRNVYFIDDEGLEFEFVEYLSADPAERNLYV